MINPDTEELLPDGYDECPGCYRVIKRGDECLECEPCQACGTPLGDRHVTCARCGEPVWQGR